MATAGTIVIELQANTAQFQQAMGRAGNSLGEVREGAGRSERALVSFAARGIGVIVPEAEGASHALLGLIEKATKGAGAMALLAKSGLVAGVAIGAFLVGQRLREEIDNWLELGETSHKTLERLKTELEEQQKFADKRAASINLLITLEGKLAQGRAKASEAAQKGSLGEDTVGSLGAGLEGRLAAINLAQRLEEANIRKTIEMGKNRDQALLASQLASNAERIAATRDFYNAVAKLQDDATNKSIELFKNETTAQLDSLQRRLDLRKRLEDQTAGLVQSGAIFDPLASGEATRKQMELEASGFALLLDKGRPWRDLQEQIFAKDQEFASKGFAGFATAVQEQKVVIDGTSGSLRSLAIDTDSLRTSWEALGQKLSNIPTAIAAAGAPIDALIQKFREMKVEALNTASAVQTLANTIATTREGPPEPIVTAPADLGFQP
jgi:hypothetical protein